MILFLNLRKAFRVMIGSVSQPIVTLFLSIFFICSMDVYLWQMI